MLGPSELEAEIARARADAEDIGVGVAWNSDSSRPTVTALRSEDATDADLMAALTDWRNKHAAVFLTRFPGTPERTSLWVRNAIGTATDRLLFVVRLQDGLPVGQIGITNILPDSAELDNVLRGDSEAIPPGLMQFALSAIERFTFERLQIADIYLSVLSDNDRAIRFYEKCGYVREREFELYETVYPEEQRSVLHVEPTGRRYEANMLRMRKNLGGS